MQVHTSCSIKIIIIIINILKMKPNNNLLINLSLLAIVVVCLIDANECPKGKIRLKDIQVLTLKPNMWTTGRRTRSVPQLNCVGGNCDAIEGQTVQCYNRGSDGVDIQWECQSSIKSGFKFGDLVVACEGYDYPDDDYVLVGSCGLEFTIQKIADSQSTYFGHSYSQSTKSKPSEGFSGGLKRSRSKCSRVLPPQEGARWSKEAYKYFWCITFIILIICLAAIIFIIYYAYLRPNGASLGRDSARSGAPPPPGFRSHLFDSNDGCGSSSTGHSAFTNHTTKTCATHSNYYSSSDRCSEPSTSTTKGFGGTKRR